MKIKNINKMIIKGKLNNNRSTKCYLIKGNKLSKGIQSIQLGCQT
jgi:hypothetical protein